MANWKKILGWTGGVVLVGGMGFGGYKAYEYFKKQDKDLDDVKTKVERVERRVETIENKVDTLAMYDEYFEYTLDSLGNVVDSAVVVAGRADSVARDANRNAKRALDCCNGSNNGNAADTSVAVVPVKKPGNSAKPTKPVKKTGSSVKPSNSGSSAKPSRPAQSGNGQSQSQQVIVVVGGDNSGYVAPRDEQRTVVIVNGDTISNTTQVIRELNADVKTWVETTRQRIR